jgi:probable F420-dependent oxidoreductase
VVGADPAVHHGWSGPYDVHTTFHEPFVLFGYLAALTSLELVTSIVILPQRQTVLVAKQAAEIDLLTQGKFRLGVGIGWNEVEYEALGQNFSKRGARLTEQVALLRRLWTETSLTVAGEQEHVTGAGIAPLPVQRPIPVWIGARADVALRRAGRIADGWFPMDQPGPRSHGPSRSCTPLRYRSGVTRRRSAWRAGSTLDRRAHHRSISRSPRGARPAPRI